MGGGPAGAAAAAWLARRGHRVSVVERRTFPRSKACGDVVTPRAVRQLHDLGLGHVVAAAHRLDGVRVVHDGRNREFDWPDHHDSATYGVVMRRRDLDLAVLDHAEDCGATVLYGHEAVEPVVERGFVRGALVRTPGGTVRTVPARYVVVADGANSSFGRALGTTRTRSWPYAAAIRSYWPSPRHGEHHLEVVPELVDRNGQALPGYGWVAPVGDGTVNVGVGLLSTARDFKGTNVAHLLDATAAAPKAN